MIVILRNIVVPKSRLKNCSIFKFFYVFILNIITFKRFPKKFPTKQNFSKIPLSTTLKTGFNFPAVGKLPYVWKYSMHDNFHFTLNAFILKWNQ